MKLKRYNEINESTDNNLGGITIKDFEELIDFIEKLEERTKNGVITDEDKILSEILYIIVTERDRLDFKTYYLRRLDAIRCNKMKTKKRGVETIDFRNLIWWLQDAFEWSYVETEGMDRVRFDWDYGTHSVWLNSDLTMEGLPPEDLREELVKKGIKITV